MMRLAGALLLLLGVIAPRVFAQTWDTSGNSLLNGTYYFRNVLWLVGDQTGTLGEAYSVYGNIAFDGNGSYTISNSQVYQATQGPVGTLNAATGTYSISASGYGSISHPLSKDDSIYGLVSNGIFVGSSTENATPFNDLFIAAQLASPMPSNSFFQGTYTLMQVDSPSFSPVDTRESQIQLTADGSGNIGTVHATGYIANNGTNVTTQNFSGIKYFFSNGAAVVSLGGTLSTSNLLAGTKYLYFSPDGNFVFGGSPQGWDMIVGVKTGSSAPNFNGLYYQAGINQDDSQFASGFADLQTYYGSLKATNGVILEHQRFLSVFQNNPIDYTYTGSYSIKSDGTYDDSNYHYLFGNGGALRIGMGDPPSIGINVAVQAPTFAPSGVFIDPTGVLNAASSALFTAGVAPGEFISIYGSNLAATTKADPTFPFNLAGVQVMVNNRPAPVYLVSPNQISAVVPFLTSEVVASIQVINNGVSSNTVTSFVNLTAPGVFTNPAGGLGVAAALHADFSLVNAAHPAQIGESISLYVTGLGAVSPAVSDGVAGPASPLSTTTNTIAVTIGGQKATTSFTGLAPQLIGLYQINLTVPAGVTNGYAYVDVQGPDFYTSEALLPVGVISSSSAVTPSSSRPASQL